MILKSSVLCLGLLLTVFLSYGAQERQNSKKSLRDQTNAIAEKIEHETGAFGLAASSGLSLSAALYLASISVKNFRIGFLLGRVLATLPFNKKLQNATKEIEKFPILIGAMQSTAIASVAGIFAVVLGKTGYDWALKGYKTYKSQREVTASAD